MLPLLAQTVDRLVDECHRAGAGEDRLDLRIFCSQVVNLRVIRALDGNAAVGAGLAIGGNYDAALRDNTDDDRHRRGLLTRFPFLTTGLVQPSEQYPVAAQR